MLVYLLTQEYLKEEYQQNAYSCVVYIVPGRLAPRIELLSRESIQNSSRAKVEFDFIKPEKKKQPVKKAGGSGRSSIPRKRNSEGKGKVTSKGKGKADEGKGSKDDDESSVDGDVSSDDELPSEVLSSLKGSDRATRSREKEKTQVTRESDDLYASDSSEEADFDWSYSMRDEPRPKRHKANVHEGGFTTTVVKEGDREVMVLSSD